MLRTQKTQHKNISRVARKNYIYIHREREREREITFFSYGRGVQNKNSLPYSEDARKNYKPTKRKPKKKKKSMRERESYHISVWEIWIKWEIIVYL